MPTAWILLDVASSAAILAWPRPLQNRPARDELALSLQLCDQARRVFRTPNLAPQAGASRCQLDPDERYVAKAFLGKR
jgi:hypothetical protein